MHRAARFAHRVQEPGDFVRPGSDERRHDANLPFAAVPALRALCAVIVRPIDPRQVANDEQDAQPRILGLGFVDNPNGDFLAVARLVADPAPGRKDDLGSATRIIDHAPSDLAAGNRESNTDERRPPFLCNR